LIQYETGIGLILGLMVLGFWLETINGKHGYADQLLAPIPLGVAGVLWLIGEYVA
jgi:hypothetical protein